MSLRVGIDVGRFPEGGRGGLQVYSRNLIASLARLEADVEFVLYGEGYVAPGGSAGRFRQGGKRGSALSRVPFLYRQFLLPREAASDRVDLLHFLFNGGSVACPIPNVVSVHDLICVLAPKLQATYLSQPYFHLRRAYHRIAIPASIRRARIVLASSQATRTDIVRLLGVPEDRVRVVPLAADPAFETPSSPGETALWRDRTGLAEPYVMGFASLDPRKNAQRLIGAFARLDPALRRTHRLAVLCTHPHPRPRLQAMAAARGIEDRVRFLPFLEETELRCLYAGATCLAFPSLYEGFGMPVLEAFWAGTAVLTSRAGSLPEVGGEAAEYVNPLSEDEIAAGLTGLLTDSARRERLVEKGKARATLFRWEETARQTLEAYEDAARTGPLAESGRSREGLGDG